MDTDPLCGHSVGAPTNPASVDPTTMERRYVVNAYYLPNVLRTNLHVLTGAHVKKIELKSSTESDGAVTATGVTFLSNGEEYTVKVNKKVLLCAGAVPSPQILELSGIDSASMLRTYDTPVMVENRSVGENLRDHALAAISYELTDSIASLDALRDPSALYAAMEAYQNHKVGPFAAGVEAVAFTPLPGLSDERSSPNASLEQLTSAHASSSSACPSFQSQYSLVNTHLLDPTESSTELMLLPFQVQPPGRSISTAPLQALLSRLLLYLHCTARAPLQPRLRAHPERRPTRHTCHRPTIPLSTDRRRGPCATLTVPHQSGREDRALEKPNILQQRRKTQDPNQLARESRPPYRKIRPQRHHNDAVSSYRHLVNAPAGQRRCCR